MAKAAFHKNQKVFVKPVGTWAVVEQCSAAVGEGPR